MAGFETLEDIKETTKFMNRKVDRGIVQESTGSVIGIKKSGDIVIASNDSAQYKMNHDSGSTTEISIQSNTITNRKNIAADELIINKHKMNPQLFELGDIRQVFDDPDKAMGNLNMCGTVLVKAWEPHLQRYVLIRRPIRTPMFSPTLNLADAPEQLGIDTSLPEASK